jgi:hypothetical protein
VVTGSGLPLATGDMTGSSAAAVAAGAVRCGIASRLAARVPVSTVVAEREAIRAGQAPEWSPR